MTLEYYISSLIFLLVALFILQNIIYILFKANMPKRKVLPLSYFLTYGFIAFFSIVLYIKNKDYINAKMLLFILLMTAICLTLLTLQEKIWKRDKVPSAEQMSEREKQSASPEKKEPEDPREHFSIRDFLFNRKKYKAFIRYQSKDKDSVVLRRILLVFWTTLMFCFSPFFFRPFPWAEEYFAAAGLVFPAPIVFLSFLYYFVCKGYLTASFILLTLYLASFSVLKEGVARANEIGRNYVFFWPVYLFILFFFFPNFTLERLENRKNPRRHDFKKDLRGAFITFCGSYFIWFAFWSLLK